MLLNKQDNLIKIKVLIQVIYSDMLIHHHQTSDLNKIFNFSHNLNLDN